MTYAHRRGGESSPCPKCKTSSPLFDWDEVDIGVGIQTWDEVYVCPNHGEFGWDSEGAVVFSR